ncbi:hypothetical protein [Lutibacter sp.]|uniref:hypothetical protein n=1 Tax=Lutibacter sp. TaxID=1925666 RepID=UPI00356177F8
MEKQINSFDFDYVRLNDDIRKLAKDYLSEITEENIKMFSESIKMVGETTLENYYLSIDNHYSEGVFKIKDKKVLSEFIDFATGYRYSMKLWARENEIKLKKIEVPNIERPKNLTYNKQHPTVILGVGTLAAVGVFIFSNIWVALLTELLVLGITYRVIKKEKKLNYEFELKKYEIQIETEKEKLINGLIEDIKEWLKKAETNSNELLKKFKV